VIGPPRYDAGMALRRPQESVPRMLMRLEPSNDPSERRRWALTVIAVIGVLAVAAAGAYWLTGAGQKPAVEVAAPPSPPTPSEPKAPAVPAQPPSKLVVGLPPITAPLATPVSPAPAPPQQAPAPGPQANPKAADP
jgi:hypothetical protein